MIVPCTHAKEGGPPTLGGVQPHLGSAGEQEVGVASGSGWNIWVWLLGVVVRRYIDFLILLIPTPLVSVLFAAASLLFVHLKKCFSFLFQYFLKLHFRF